MPQGESITLTGLPLADGRQLVLRNDDGGERRLETTRSRPASLGRRVSVAGTRDGFDLIAVMGIDPV
jgi:hypothetical protein